jgi:hypothetical protein
VGYERQIDMGMPEVAVARNFASEGKEAAFAATAEHIRLF